MKIISLKNLPDFALPLPIYHSVRLADAIGKDGEEFGVFVGLNEKCVEQLKKFSLNKDDVELQNNTGDKERFGEGLYEDWYAKNRTPFCLIHKRTDALAALVWLGPKPLFTNDNNNWQVISWRSYPPFRRKGIMKNFTQFAMDVYKKSVPDAKIWTTIKRNNFGSAQLAVNLDFEILDEVSDDLSLVMVKK